MSIRYEYTKYGQLKAKILKGESKPLSSRLVQEGSKTYFSVIWTKTFRKREGLRHSFFTFRMDGQIATAITKEGTESLLWDIALLRLFTFRDQPHSFPLVCINTKPWHFEGVYSVVSNDEQGMNLLTQHLLRLGHRRIGLLYWEKYQDVENFCRQNRVAAFQKAMRKYGLPDNLLSGMQWSREMDQALHRLLKQNVTAIITTAEGDEYRALYHLKQFGLNVPDDLSLAGWLHPEFSRFCDPPITGIEQNYRFLAQHAVALFNRLLHKESVAGDVLLDYNFFERCTTAPPGEYKKHTSDCN